MQLGPSDEDINVEFSRIGPATNPMTDQLKEMNMDANWGTKNIEIGFLFPEHMQKTPKHYYEELGRLAKLTGVKPSIHAPIVNLAGLVPKQGHYSEINMEMERRRLKEVIDEVIDNADKVFDNKGGIVNIHASEGMSNQSSYVPENASGEEVIEVKNYVDLETDKVVTAQRKKRYVDGKIIYEEADEMVKKYEGHMAQKVFGQVSSLEEQKMKYEANLQMMRAKLQDLKDLYGSDLTEQRMKGDWKAYTSALNNAARLQSELQTTEENLEESGKELHKYMMDYNKGYAKYGNLKKYIKSVEKKYGSVNNYIKGKAEEKYASLKGVNKDEFDRKVKRDVELLYGRFHRFGIIYPEEELKRYQSIQDYELGRTSDSIKEAALYSLDKYGENAPTLSIDSQKRKDE